MNPMPGDVQFLRPLWLLGLLAIPPLLWWLHQRRLQRDVWRDAVDAHLLQHLLQDAQTVRGGWRARVPAVASTLGVVLTVLALAGPSWRELPQPLWQDRNPLVIAVDLSYASMTADVQPSRLLQARAKIGRILHTRAGGQIALVAFADDAYIVSPLTEDADNVALYLDALSPEVMPRDGSRADRAIEESVRLLKRAGFGRGDILLMTDHSGGAAGSAAVEARKAGYRVSVLGLGTAAGGAYRTPDGGVATARLEAGALRQIASAGGGDYAAAVSSDQDLRALGVLEADTIDASAAQGKRGAAPLDEGFWLLPPLLLLALLAFRRGVLAVVVLVACLPWQPAAAADGTLWQRADQREHAQLEQGVTAYRAGDYNAAGEAWQDLPGADAAYNRGNALAKQGRYDDAIAEYERALKLRPDMRDAAENRRRVEAERKRKPPPQQNQPQKKDQQNDQKNDQQKNQQGKQDNPQQQNGDAKPRDSDQGPKQNPQEAPPQDQPSGNGKPQEAPSGKQQPQERQQQQPQPAQRQQPATAPEPPKLPDAKEAAAQEKAQRQADAAQRERMRRAQEKAQQNPQKPSATNAATQPGSESKESAADRERRIANEAWLRRVPDDPGGLLRAKFKLEEKRRRREGDR